MQSEQIWKTSLQTTEEYSFEAKQQSLGGQQHFYLNAQVKAQLLMMTLVKF